MNGGGGGGGGGGGDDDDDADLQRALALSMMETTAAPPPAAAAAAAAANNRNHNTNDDDNDEDADLAAALQLSLQQASGGDKDDDEVMMSVETTPMDEPMKKPAASSSSSQVEPIIPTVDLAQLQRKNARVGLWYQTAQPTNILNCHYILWDDGITTTRNDQQRWLAQSIDFKSSRGAPQTATTTSTSTTPDSQAQASSSIHPGADETVLGAIICHSERWGLTQAHGGPCGVLASIQAELMRLLLFGPRIHDGDGASGASASASSDGSTVLLPVHIPTQLTNHFCQAKPDLSPSFLTSALALSIGMVLARAALQPSATQNDHSNENENEKGEQDTNNIMVVDNEEESPSSSTSRRPAVVKLVFPKPRPNNDDKSSSSSSWASSPYASRQLDWHHLAPWTSNHDPTASDSANASGLSDHLVTYTISLEEEEPQQESSTTTSSTTAASTTITTPTNNDDEESSKRQKRFRKNTPTSLSSSSPQRRDHSSSEQQQHETPMSSSREELLAQAVAEFLLETKLMESWYHRQGGVLLFVLALVESRGAAHIQGDMDDPTAKLTSQFGHCSQELINLLLTGQAVSNVFDNTLRPSGELICRGIQKRPVIGYLSQLESMRYVEVGGYYKQPQFPIWVVGSTSHFTLLFGDATCLYESQSDRILERVRRAFKQMDGGEEQGFIQLDQLGDFLRKLDLYETLGDHGVQALGATMEVHGAGILLWEDVWKRTSRLLTGASLETVLNMDEGTTTTNANNNVSSVVGYGGVYGGGNSSSTALVPSAASSLSSTRTNLEAGSSVPPPLMPAMLADDNFNYNDNDVNASPPMTDEEYARLLQAEWNGDLLPTPTSFPAPAPLPTAITTTTTTTTTPSNNNHNHNHNQHNNSGQKETFGTTFQLYHYNGLRGGYMKPFRVTRLSAEEAIGTSVALGVNHAQSGGGGGRGASSGGATMSANYQEGGLEDVLRTKWPSCKIDWLHGGSPPSID